MHRILIKNKMPKKQSYNIFVGSNLLENLFKFIPFQFKGRKIVIITDNTIKKLYISHLSNSLSKQGLDVLICSFPSGEKNKTCKTKQKIEKKMFRAKCGRDSLIIAVGGGVVGDMAGYVASTYMRGLPFIQVPTSLLAMVDSSIGGKTAIDTPFGKNLIGTFWHPQAVIMDIQCLKSLPIRHIVNGLIEALKIFLICDYEYFFYFQKNIHKLITLDRVVIKKIILHAIKIKARIVSEDTLEEHKRKILNFGHTIGHSLELLLNYKLLHGYAVALGLLIETKISCKLGLCLSEDYKLIAECLSKLGIKRHCLKNINISRLIQYTKLDKKVKGADVHYVLLQQIGKVYIKKNQYTHSVKDSLVNEAFYEVLSELE